MKRVLFFLSTISMFFYLSCSTETEARKQRMQRADDEAYLHTLQSLQDWPGGNTPNGQAIIQSTASSTAAAASHAEGALMAVPRANEINPNTRVPRHLKLEFNPYEVDGEMHNDAIALIVKERLEGVNVLDKLMSKDRETIDKFLKLNPQFQDDNVRRDAVDAVIAEEIPAELQDRLIKITYAKDLMESISYLDLSAYAKSLVTEVHITCNDYYTTQADFEQVAGYLNGKITSLLNKGKDMTIEDQQLAGMFTVLKHSYYYWHGTK